MKRRNWLRDFEQSVVDVRKSVTRMAYFARVLARQHTLPPNQQVKRLRARIRQLETALGIFEEKQLPWFVPPHALTILQLLMKRPIVPIDAAVEVIWGALPDADKPVNARRIVYMAIHDLRRRLKRYQVYIHTDHGSKYGQGGYYIKASDKVRMQQYLEDFKTRMTGDADTL